jgi:uncharacterized protein
MAPTTAPRPGESLCLACGLCCNGVLFKDVEVLAGDDVARLQALGLTLEKRKAESGRRKFPQPCVALCADGRCGIYADRPTRCRKYECALLKQVLAGSVESGVALRTIRRAQKLVGRVQRLLRELGDADEQRALTLRFKRTKQRIESGPIDEVTGDTYGELTLAIHELNVLLHREFHLPAPG